MARAHVLVAGGTGLIGRALVEALVARSQPVTVASREGARVDVPAGARACAYDDLPGDVGAVVNLAGANLAGRRWTKAYRQELVDSRVAFTAELVERVRAAGARPEVWVNASAVGIYGDRGDEVLDEASAPGQGFLAELCAAWERAAAGAEALGARVVVLRLGIVLARAGGALPRMALPFRLFAGGPLGSGRQYVSWIHIEDAVRLFQWALDEPSVRGVYHATAPEPCTNRELCRALGAALRRPCWLPVPRPALRIAAGEVARYLLESQRAIPAKALAGGFRFRHERCGEALAAIYR